MIDKTKLAELRKHWEKECNPDCGFEDEQDCPIDMDDVFGTISTLIDENEKLRRVKEAAEEIEKLDPIYRVEVKEYADKCFGLGWDASLVFICRRLRKSFAALEGKE